MPLTVSPSAAERTSCAMGRIYRFIEPTALLLLAEMGRAHGYELHRRLCEYSLTESNVDRAALYRTLHTLEKNGYVRSHWDAGEEAPARRTYALTAAGRRHLSEWSSLLARLGKAMDEFATQERSLQTPISSPSRR